MWPLTVVSTKQLLPIFDKPMIYYPLTTLMLDGIRDILIITAASEVPRFEALLGDGSRWGISISYAVQAQSDGIAKAFIIGEKFIDGQNYALILDDNIFYGAGLGELVYRVALSESKATVFCHWVNNPKRYGILEFDGENRPVCIEEKSKQPKIELGGDRTSSIVDVARKLKPSARGELEITDANRVYLEAGRLSGRGFAWFDAGTHHSLLQASEFIYMIGPQDRLS